MKEAKIQWHSAFVFAMGVDFGQDRAGLILEKEYNLNTRPLEIMARNSGQLDGSKR